jgi:hypothetical protein
MKNFKTKHFSCNFDQSNGYRLDCLIQINQTVIEFQQFIRMLCEIFVYFYP